MINTPDPHERDWILGLLHRHTSDALSILGELLKASLILGTCSVNDIATIPTDKGVTGAVMKLLKEMGFEHTKEKIPDMRLGKKGKVSVWKLVDKSKVETYLDYQLQYFHVLLHEPLPETPHCTPQGVQKAREVLRKLEEPY
jgi:hypothetical protein